MAEYTTTREAFQRAMERSLTGRPEDSKLYTESTATPAFYQVMKNGRRIPYADHQFLRDGAETEFESFMFAKVDRETEKMEWLVERAQRIQQNLFRKR
ncbi:uncharacterized protein GGS25DRAFT_525116 [Hypoxylon fragiforme]|uniref:uncharacterized protein n=1 Tax=Hypoxylon fragiforme TaxID=63214 RepID=UPI0020C6D011|nr:uncharacterized protein GGS25DRAFT_525116 [Hypoxylon fragiforme]KAI2603842.1 hypothetical protein GGS25DRAFT_525116 [Hypoxylon fragiforme]